MNKISIIFIISLLMLLLIGNIPNISGASNSTGIILKANVSPLYIENQSIFMQLQALYFVNNIPQGTMINYEISIFQNNNLIEKGDISGQNGMIINAQLNGLPVGLYSYSIVASSQGVISPINSGQFLVTYPPVSYTAYFLSNGKFVFHSDQYTIKGKYDPNYTFTIVIQYIYVGGGSYIAHTFYNVTNMTFTPPNMGQIVAVNIIDRWGWINSASINIAQMQFVGIPLTYDFSYYERSPYSSVWWQNLLIDVIIIALIFLVLIWYVRSRT